MFVGMKSESLSNHRLSITFSFLGRHNEHTNKEEIVGVKGEGIPTEDLRMMITDATKCPQLIGNLSNLFAMTNS